MVNLSALRSGKAVLLAVGVALLLPSVALGQATRTWVSGVGDDANPCSRTAPCKTFAGAISKTAAKGEIDVLDPGGFGAVTITKSITIDGRGVIAGILVSGTHGIIINAGAADRITIRNLTLNGLGTSLDGIRILAAKSVRVEHTEIFGFTNGIQDMPTAGKNRLTVQDSSIYANDANGVLVAPPVGTAANTVARATLRRVDLDDNANGVTANGTNGRAAVNLIHSAIGDSGGASGTGIGVHVIAANGIFRMSDNDISGNLVGLQADSGGTIVSSGDNLINGNTVDGSPTSTIGRS